MEPTGEREKLQREIAALAARMIVEEGRDRAQAKRKAAAAVAGERALAVLPDNEQLEAALRQYLRTVGGAAHRALLHGLRCVAAQWMQILEEFRPYLVGDVLDGSATEHSALRLNLYTESAKDVELALLERGVDFRVGEPPGREDHAQEVIGFLVPGNAGGPREPLIRILLTVYAPQALRVAAQPRVRSTDPLLHPIERRGRADLALVRELLSDCDDGEGVQSSRA
ncbi:MAG TPA: hypothetical protein VED47_13045 [Burkholderiaceae bacterium]|nr:hypothetical protein [Burkholderiaceae bacterium]